MEQIDPRYLSAIIAILNGSEVPVTHFEYGQLKIKFYKPELEAEPASGTIPGFVATISPNQPTRPDEDSPGAMHMRAMHGRSLPDLNPAPPKTSGE